MEKKTNQPIRYAKKSESRGISSLWSAIIGFLTFIVCDIILCILGAMIINKNSDPAPLVPFISTISMTVSSIIGGLLSTKISKDTTLTTALIFLGAITLAVLLASVINLKFRESSPLWRSLILKIPVILGGIFGGFIGSYQRPKKSLYSKYK